MFKSLPFALLAFLLAFCNHEKKSTTAVVAANPNAHPDWTKFCASCHGPDAETFNRREWKYGTSRLDIGRAIRDGYPDSGMPAFGPALGEAKVLELADYIVKTREQQRDKGAVIDGPKPQTFKSEGKTYRLDTIAAGLDSPWGMAFLPTGDLIFTEKTGSIWRIDPAGKKTQINGAPKVMSGGQGGLLDIELHPSFAQNQIIYFTYSKLKEGEGATQSATAVLRARLEGNNLVDARDIFVAEPYVGTQHHFGSRMEFGRDGYLYVTVGERGRQDEFPQVLDKAHGKVHRITENGDIPADNPFYNKPGALRSIWSYGHRNPQGLAFDPASGILWEHEHGPRGGDELNRIQPGKNYGWPVVSYGTHYDGRAFTDKTTMDGIEPPVTYWVPSIAPCGMAFITGDRYPTWKGNLLAGSLRFRYLNRCVIKDNQVVKQENLLDDVGRVRCITMSNDGYIYFSVENPGFIFRIVPVK
ncbi:MAG: PQQ-dependent sugar dehydrogenase [Saprospiraceae bacterium]|nr:PQQ-dependent sugar dehydrogenase [Saprospiraceae bacterium]